MDLCATPAVELARLIRARELSAAELLAAVLARIGAVNPAINAIVTLAAEQACAAAAGLDARAARGSFAGPLHGLPIAVKDLAETAGIRTTFGSPVFASFVPSFDAPHVARLKQAGAVVIGKTNTPEFGAGSQTFNPVFGPTRNPYDPGSPPAAAAAGPPRPSPPGWSRSRTAPTWRPACGTRPPSAAWWACGPRRAWSPPTCSTRWPWSGRSPAPRRTPRCCWPGCAARIPGCPWRGPIAPATSSGCGRRRCAGCGWPGRTTWGTCRCSPRSARCSRRCAGSLEGAGCAVTDAAPALADADEVFQVLRAARMAALAPLLRAHRDQVKATLAWNIEKGIALTGEQIAAARDGQAEIFRRFRSFLADGPYEVLALPAVQVLPFPVEQEWVTEINGEPMATYIDWMRSCSRITVTVHPAVSVPAGLTAAGLPVGLQLVGRYGADRRLLEIAAAIMALTTLLTGRRCGQAAPPTR